MKQVLIIGDANHILIKTFSAKLRSEYPGKLNVDIFNTAGFLEKDDSYDRILPIRNPLKKIKYVAGLYLSLYYFLRLLTLKKYDIIHIHFAGLKIIKFPGLLSRRSGKLIVSIWGSDFYKRDDKTRKQLGKLLERADFITFSNREMLKSLVAYYGKYAEKSQLHLFGLETFTYIEELEGKSTKACKALLGLNAEKVVVAVGNTGTKNNQHYKILEAITTSSHFPVWKERVQFIFPLTYGFEPGYRDDLIKYIESLGMDVHLFDKFLSFRDLALLRRSSDIMINLQETDQFSGAMQEHILAGSIIITGSWLPYQVLYDDGVQLITVDRVQDIDKVLHQSITSPGTLISEQALAVNKEKIKRFGSWSNCITSWGALYEV